MPATSPDAPAPRSNGIPLFRLFGIQVYLHWLWIVVAVYEINTRSGSYSSPVWNVAEYLALFAIVLLHEFGHALACKSVGGEANRIMLWPLGGVAFVNPPQRPGAVLWSIAAGPLVNVVLAPFLIGAYLMIRSGAIAVPPDVRQFAFAIMAIDIVLFLFNMLPIYPLDGGQILRALLWFVIGRSKSLMVASVIGMVGAAGVMLWAISTQSMWFILLALFGMFTSLNGFQQARLIAKLSKMPRHAGIACPSCGEAPPAAPLWRCSCGAAFDAFETGATCPQCGNQFETTLCPYCGKQTPLEEWRGIDTITPSTPPPPLNVPVVIPGMRPPPPPLW